MVPDVANNELLEKLAIYTGISKEKIQYFGSSDYLQEYISLCYLDEGDTVLIVGPTYDNFRVTAESLGSKVEFFYLMKALNSMKTNLSNMLIKFIQNLYIYVILTIRQEH